MKIYEAKQSRQQYFQIQIKRSQTKFRFCKVSVADAIKYASVIQKYLPINNSNKNSFKLVCMGTRNGREIDLFRLAFKHFILMKILKSVEWHKSGFHSVLDKLFLSIGRSDLARFEEGGVFGVEINPMAERKDVYIGSFDELPPQWEGSIDVIYSNSFDQSQDPYKTAGQWRKVLKKGGLLIIAVNHNQQVSNHDPVGMISLEDIRLLFPGELLCYQYQGSENNYSEGIIRNE